MDRPTRYNTRIVKILVEKGLDQGYFLELEKSILTCDDPSQLEEAEKIFAEEGLSVIFKAGQQYIGTCSTQICHNTGLFSPVEQCRTPK
eukprot:1423678-Ditylum_brightwellii.AAC.1